MHEVEQAVHDAEAEEAASGCDDSTGARAGGFGWRVPHPRAALGCNVEVATGAAPSCLVARLCRLPGITQRGLPPRDPNLLSHSACRHSTRQLRLIWRWWQHTQVCIRQSGGTGCLHGSMWVGSLYVGKLVWLEEHITQLQRSLSALSSHNLIGAASETLAGAGRCTLQACMSVVTSRACDAAIIVQAIVSQRTQAIACLRAVSCCCMPYLRLMSCMFPVCEQAASCILCLHAWCLAHPRSLLPPLLQAAHQLLLSAESNQRQPHLGSLRPRFPLGWRAAAWAAAAACSGGASMLQSLASAI